VVAKWIRKNWDVLTVVAIAVAVSVVFLWLIFRPVPLPPGYEDLVALR
jgi:hypothetical protein